MELLLVFGRLLFSSVSNVFQKQLSNHGLHPFFIVAATYIVLATASAPFLLTAPFAELSTTFWINVFLSALFDVGGWMFLVMSLSRTDLSVFGPLNAYKVVISMLLALAFLGEVPSLQGLLGVAVIIGGSFLLLPPQKDAGVSAWACLLRDRGVQARFLSIVLFSIGTVFLKNAVLAGSAFDTLIFWSLMGLPLIITANIALLPEPLALTLRTSRPHYPAILGIGLLVFAMQYMTLILLSQMLVAYALALFQLGMLLQVFLGFKIFKEEHLWRRLGASLVMMTGSLMVLIQPG